MILAKKILAAFVLIATLSSPAILTAQDISKRPLEHADYDRWNSLGQISLSNDGKWVIYSIRSGKTDGDTILKIRKLGAPKEYTIVRGSEARFSFDSQFAVYRIQPDQAKLKKLKKAKAKPDEMPTAKLQILDLSTGSQTTMERIKSFGMPAENGDWIAIHKMKPPENSAVQDKPSSVNESYEITQEGLRRPAKKFKLKKRAQTEEAEAEEKKKESKPKSKKEQVAKPKADNADEKKKEKDSGTTLILRNLATGNERSFPNVVSYQFSKFGDTLAWTTSVKQDKSSKKGSEDKTKSNDKDARAGKKADAEQEPGDDRVFVFDLAKMEKAEVFVGQTNFKQIQLNDAGSQLAFLADQDDFDADTPAFALYLSTGAKKAKLIANESTKGIPAGWWVSSSANLTFAEDDRRLFFSTSPVPEKVVEEREKSDKKKNGEKVEEDDEEPKAKLDLWHWQDPLLQPQQLLQAESERRRSYRAVYDLKKKKIYQLATKQMPQIQIDRRSKSDIVVANTNWRYRKMMSWDVQTFQDTYVVNLKNGEREMVREKVRGPARISPEGKFITWFDAEQLIWYSLPTDGGKEPIEISAGINHPLQNELHDTPSLPRAYGIAGWMEDDKSVLIYDRYDIWQVDPTGKTETVCLTEGQGRENKIRLRYLQLDREERAIAADATLMLSAFDETSKASGFYRLALADKKSDDKPNDQSEENANEGEETGDSKLQKIMMLDEGLNRLSKARDGDSVVMVRESFRNSPDIWSSDMEFKKIHRLSDVNPQQEEYLWGDVELVKWKATDGQDLEGLLYKPDGFDPDKKYPLMVYFYERNSDNLHRYYGPAAGRSIINFSFYVSRGYVIFVPDIPYKTGEPGPSAANSILPGVEAIVERGFIDKEKIGMQGHSWGGYQTAYLVTQTNMFCCAESGAPVSNMTSAYGGIRWSSGMSRMFQYERTQSRIGDDLWSAREKYIANSPLFFADKIETPLLILHNDEDGAVPWYQGIELFVAMRRLGKPAWLLNYNEQPHWVMKPENRLDFAIRMQQFFDHYMLDTPEPEWMAVGIPAVDKGKEFGLELLEPEKPKSEEVEAESPEAESPEAESPETESPETEPAETEPAKEKPESEATESEEKAAAK